MPPSPSPPPSAAASAEAGLVKKRRLKFKLLSQLVALSPIARSSRFLESQSGWQVRTLSLSRALSRTHTHSHTPAHKIVTEIVFFSPSGFCGREKGESETGPDVGTGERGREKPRTLSLPFSFSLTLSLSAAVAAAAAIHLFHRKRNQTVTNKINS